MNIQEKQLLGIFDKILRSIINFFQQITIAEAQFLLIELSILFVGIKIEERITK